MQELKQYFITVDREYKEGDVAVFRQKFSGKDIVKAVLFSTALGVYEAEINGKKSWKADVRPRIYLLPAASPLSGE